jgi:hypothetical protein
VSRHTFGTSALPDNMSLSSSPPIGSQGQHYQRIVESDGIRLVVIRPNEDEEAGIKCRLEHTTLSNYEDDVIDHFIALSYVWGDAQNVRNIIVNGFCVHVTANLEAALRHIRDAKRSVRVWADALCINQLDEGEKNTQVQQMGRVYTTAEHTIIYLGNLDVETSALLDEMDHLQKSPVIYRLHRFQKTTLSEKVACQSAIVRNVLSRPWFTRVWVLQELVLSRDPWIQFGRKRVRWLNLWTLTSMLQTSLRPNPSIRWSSTSRISQKLSSRELENANESLKSSPIACLEYMQTARDVAQGKHASSNSLDLINLLQSRRGFGATDSRDLIYAHLGLATDFSSPEWPGPTVDYSKSASQIFTDITRYLIVRYNDFRVIGYVGGADPMNQVLKNGIPSWVPDWSSTKGQIPLLIHPHVDRSFSYSHISESYEGNNGHILICRGMLIGRVLEVGRSASSLHDSNGLDIKKEWTNYRMGMKSIRTAPLRTLISSKKKLARNRSSKKGVRFPKSFESTTESRQPLAKIKSQPKHRFDKWENSIFHRGDAKISPSHLSRNEPCLKRLLKTFTKSAGLHELLHYWPTEWPTEWANEELGVGVQHKLGASKFLSLLCGSSFYDYIGLFVKNGVSPLSMLVFLLFNPFRSRSKNFDKLKDWSSSYGGWDWSWDKALENYPMFQKICQSSNSSIINVFSKHSDLSSDSEPDPHSQKSEDFPDEEEWDTDISDNTENTTDGDSSGYTENTIATIPASSQPGDLICALKDTRGYFVIRPFSGAGTGNDYDGEHKTFIVVGSCLLTFELYINWDVIQDAETLAFY